MSHKTISEFQKFIMRGNVIDMAVGVIIGGAFGKIVTSLVNDIIMPPIGRVLGKVNFSDLFLSLDGRHYVSLVEAQKAAAPTLNYGLFINNVINFFIVAFCIFIMVNQIQALHKHFEKPEAPAPAATKECSYCYSTIPVKAVRCSFCTSDLAAAVK